MNLRYLLGAAISIPLLPIMYFHGKQIRASVPDLPEATGLEGSLNEGRKRKLKLATIGESTIAGVGVNTHEEGFTGTLAVELSENLKADVQWKVYAKSGYTVSKVKDKIIPQIDENHLDVIVIGMGGNDAFKLNNPTKWKKDIKALLLSLKEKYPKTPIIFTNMPPIKEFPAFTTLIKFTIGNLVEILGQELKQVITQFENVYYNENIITIADWIDRLKLDVEPKDFFSDGVHPSKLTYQIWAKDIALFISKNDEIKNKIVKLTT